MITEKTDYRATAPPTTGGGQNILLMNSGDLQFGQVDSGTLKNAFEGKAAFEGNPQKGIMAVANVYPIIFQQLVRPGSNISNFSDIKGKRMIVGGPNSGTEDTTRQVYNAHGIDYVDRDDIIPEYLGTQEGSQLIQNNQADGITCVANIPFAPFVELTMIGKGEILTLNPEGIEELTKEGSAFLSFTIPAGTYSNQEEDIETVVTPSFLCVHEDVDEEVVYEVTKVIFENLDYLRNQHAAFNALSLDNGPNVTIPLHPGAERYYKEVGVLN